jgi:hypothetical protein
LLDPKIREQGFPAWGLDKKCQRSDPDILPGTVWVTLFIGFVLQAQSLEELERRARVCFKKLLPRKQTPPSADTIRLSSTSMDLEPIKNIYVETVNKARRNKMMPTIVSLRVAAIDGAEQLLQFMNCQGKLICKKKLPYLAIYDPWALHIPV